MLALTAAIAVVDNWLCYHPYEFATKNMLICYLVYALDGKCHHCICAHLFFILSWKITTIAVADYAIMPFAPRLSDYSLSQSYFYCFIIDFDTSLIKI